MKHRLVIENSGRDRQTIDRLGRRMRKRIKAHPVGVCPVDTLLGYVRLCHTQSCGKCTPCRIGLGQLADLLESIRDGRAAPDAIELLRSTAEFIRQSSDCAIGYGAAEMVLDGCEGFAADLQSHLQSGQCLYGMKYAIPCIEGCPAHVDIPGYIALTLDGRYDEALRLIRKDNPFPASCGYICEHPCELHCRRMMVDDPINICGIKRFAFDHAEKDLPPVKADPTGKRIAVVGGGPGGLTCAYFLTLMGHEVTVYELRDQLGGMMRYGIPDYRLPQAVLDADIRYILDTGVQVKYGVNIGEEVPIGELQSAYDAVYISIGAHDDRKLGIAGEEAENVVSAIGILREIGEGKSVDLRGRRVVVIGGGNVAMDATRTSLRLGARTVDCVYRRREEDMTAQREEIEDAKAEGARLRTLLAPDHIELDEEGRACALWVQPQMVSAISPTGRTGVRPAAQDPVRIPCDFVIVAIGQSIHSKPFELSGMQTKRGAIQASLTSFVPGSGNVFAGGDAVSGPATVIRAVAAGKVAADNIDSFLGYAHRIGAEVNIPDPPLSNLPPCGRVNNAQRMVENIEGDFDLVSLTMSREGCQQECQRCLRCDHFGYGSFRGGRQKEW